MSVRSVPGLVAVFHAQNHRTGGQEEQRFEEGVGDQVEHRAHVRAHAHRRHHKAQLADGGIGQHLFNVKLPHGDGGGKQGGDRPHPHHRRLGRRSQVEQRGRARHQIDAGGDHRGGMDQRRDGRGAGHGVWQPRKQRQLRRFAGDAQQHKQGDEHQHRRGHGARRGEDRVKVQAAEGPEDGEDGNQQAEIANAVDHKRLLAGFGIGNAVLTLFVPEADQQVRAQAHAFPTHEQHQVVVGRHQDHHSHDEQVEIDEEAGVAARVAVVAHVGVHVARGVDVDQRAHAGDDQHHRHRKGIHAEIPVDRQIAGADPLEERHHRAFGLGGQRQRQQHRHDKRRARGQHGHRPGKRLPQPPAQQQIDHQADQREEDHPGDQAERWIGNSFLEEHLLSSGE